jgi:hypothetical protein
MKAPGANAGSGSISRLGPQFADRRPRIPRLRRSNFQPRSSKFQNSNREKEACFSEKDRQGQSEEKSKAALGFVRGDANGGRRGRSKRSAPTKANAKGEPTKTNSRPSTFVSGRKN